MRTLVLILLCLLVALQLELWYGEGGVRAQRRMEIRIGEQKAELRRLEVRNRMLQQEILDLKEGMDAIEERARSEMGMIKRGEIFYQINQHKAARARPGVAPLASPADIPPPSPSASRRERHPPARVKAPSAHATAHATAHEKKGSARTKDAPAHDQAAGARENDAAARTKDAPARDKGQPPREEDGHAQPP
jgi:cell division protein FtsB